MKQPSEKQLAHRKAFILHGAVARVHGMLLHIEKLDMPEEIRSMVEVACDNTTKASSILSKKWKRK